MFSPTDLAPTSNAPRLAASIIPGPPPVITDRMLFTSAMIRTAHETAEFTSHLVKMTLGLDSLSTSCCSCAGSLCFMTFKTDSEKIYHRDPTSPDSRLLASRIAFPVGTPKNGFESWIAFCR